jgi:hypothetical protein
VPALWFSGCLDVALLGPAAMTALRPLPGVERTSSVVIHAARIYESAAWFMSMADMLLSDLCD